MHCAPLIHLFALHFGQYHETAETLGLGAVCALEAPAAAAPVELAAGFYRNSDRKNSVYAVAGYQPWSIGPLRVGAFVGTVSEVQLSSRLSFQPLSQYCVWTITGSGRNSLP